MHVTSSFFSIEWFELRSEVLLPAACLEVFEVSCMAGKYLVIMQKYNLATIPNTLNVFLTNNQPYKLFYP